MVTTVARPDAFSAVCPTRQALDRISDKWTSLVISRLSEGTKRFSELRRGIGGISQKMLTQTLRSLERDGLVERHVYAVVPPRVEYSLTPLGVSLTEPLQAVVAWAESSIDDVLRAQAAYDAAQERAAS